MSETLEIYICNIREGNARPVQNVHSEATATRNVRAPKAPPALVGALGSAEEDLRRHGICAPAAMVGSAACTTEMGDGWMDGEGASGTCV
jgi:hypothetical protein